MLRCVQVLPASGPRWPAGQARQIGRLLPHLLLPERAGQRAARVQLRAGPQ